MGAEKYIFLMVLGLGCGYSGHVNASHGFGSDIFTGFIVIAILGLKRFFCF